MGDHLVALVHLLLADARAAAAAPGHAVVRLVDELALVALLEKRPDRVVVFLRHREVAFAFAGRLAPVGVGAVPVHPLAEADRLLRLATRELVDAVFAFLHKPVDALRLVPRHQVFDVALRLQLQLLLDLNLDPQPLAVEAVLVAQLMAGHGEETLIRILVGAAPGVMDAHRIVRGDRAVEKGPLGLAAVLLTQTLEGLDLVPQFQDRAFLGREIDSGLNFLERHRRCTS
ncbi:MAG TPA: hypothetical protein VFE62_03970 [Gemmataceae bacterium]|nr:hypothetical protein [Gemmataceae bacterium]